MAEYIELDRACKEVERFIGYLDDDMINRIKIALKRLPAYGDVAPVRRGHWISYADLHSSCCSECNAWWIPWGEGYKETYRYCPNCGAKMAD